MADLVKSTLGPKGMDKILSSVSSADGNITITNDGATILRSIHVDNAAAKVCPNPSPHPLSRPWHPDAPHAHPLLGRRGRQVLVDISRIQDEEVGDGTTSVAVCTDSPLSPYTPQPR